MRLFLACLLFVIVSGCANRPIIDSATPRSISVRYDELFGSAKKATKVAQKHCQKYGKEAELISHNDIGRNWIVINFRCVD